MDCIDDVRVAAGRRCAALEQEADRLEGIAKGIASGAFEAADGLSDQGRAELVEALFQEVGRKWAASIIAGGAILP
ncbi:hypothetical protein AB0952_09395 [Streptomyces caniferus]|uniref:hypothetical protein n=1 Tax=Streptomyces caniferus TaxID=285557 RepID=UPI003451EAF9